SSPTVSRELVAAIGERLGLAASSDDRIYDALGSFGNLVRNADTTTFVPTVVNAGSKGNVVPGEGEGDVDCRFVPGGSDNALAALNGVIAGSGAMEILAKTPGIENASHDDFLEACEEAIHAEDPAGEILPFVQAGYTDGQHLAALGIRP